MRVRLNTLLCHSFIISYSTGPYQIHYSDRQSLHLIHIYKCTNTIARLVYVRQKSCLKVFLQPAFVLRRAARPQLSSTCQVAVEPNSLLCVECHRSTSRRPYQSLSEVCNMSIYQAIRKNPDSNALHPCSPCGIRSQESSMLRRSRL